MSAQTPGPERRALHGILLLDKPTGLTSNQALQRVKKLFNARKAGHTGSLDPLATGMLPICFGEATKLTAFLLDARKVYRVAARLGVSTDTGDADGTPTAEVERSSLDPAQIDAALAATIGPMEQTPPMYSALKRGGKPLYVLARQGIVVPRQPRTVQIFDARRLGFDWPILEFSVLCSKGTYIRTFVEDLARALGTLGHVAGLRRLAVEPFEESGMIPLDSLSERGAAGLEALDAALLPVDSALPHWPRLVVSEAACRRLTQGQAMAAEPSWPEGRVRLYSPEGCLVGIGEVSPRRELVPRRIFPGLGPWC